MLESTYKHLRLLDVDEWGTVILDDRLFLTCTGNVKQKITARSSFTSAVSDGGGLFNLVLSGN